MKLNTILKFEVNQLARLFYKMQGYNAPEGFDFTKSKHPTELLMFEYAKISLEFWEARKRV